MRKDILPGLQLSQSCHACFEFSSQHPDIHKSWYNNSNYIAILSADNEQHLHRITSLAEERGVKFSKFYEPDLDNQLTAIALQPGRESKRLCSSLPLALRNLSNDGAK